MQASLARGSGARRLNLAKSRSGIQLLLVQACGEIWAAHGHRLEQEAVIVLLDVLFQIGSNARAVDGNGNLRRELALAQMRDEVHPNFPLALQGFSSSLQACGNMSLFWALPCTKLNVLDE